MQLNTPGFHNRKRRYLPPEVKKILIDRSISIQMESSPPGDPYKIDQNQQNPITPYK